MTATLARVGNVTKNYQDSGNYGAVISGLTLNLQKGQHVALVGANGSGKTTFLRLLAGVDLPDEGSIEIELSASARTTYIPQDYRNALLPWFDVKTNLLLGCEGARSTGLQATRKQHVIQSELLSEAEELASFVHVMLPWEKYPYQLSGGEQQFLLFVRTLLSESRFLLLDEPFSAIDLRRRKMLTAILGDRLHKDSGTLIFSSHDLEDAIFLADRILVFSREKRGLSDDIAIPFPWPRTAELRETPQFRELLAKIADSL